MPSRVKRSWVGLNTLMLVLVWVVLVVKKMIALVIVSMFVGLLRISK